MKRLLMMLGCALVLVFAAYQVCPFLTPSAPARTFNQAANDAQYYAQADCGKNHKHSVCKNAAGWIDSRGLGHGMWRGHEETWVCSITHLCAYAGDYTSAQWDQCRDFRILRGGGRDQISAWRNC